MAHFIQCYIYYRQNCLFSVYAGPYLHTRRTTDNITRPVKSRFSNLDSRETLLEMAMAKLLTLKGSVSENAKLFFPVTLSFMPSSYERSVYVSRPRKFIILRTHNDLHINDKQLKQTKISQYRR